MAPRTTLSLAQARRIALAAQGFHETRPDGTNLRHVKRLLQRSHLLQIDSVNVLVRAHYMPLFSRLGAYDRGLLETIAYHPKKRETFEYWGHEASLISLDLHPLFRWRMARAARGEGTYGGLARFGREKRTFIEQGRRGDQAQGGKGGGGLSIRGQGPGARGGRGGRERGA